LRRLYPESQMAHDTTLALISEQFRAVAAARGDAL
jgi:hypothetical protein